MKSARALSERLILLAYATAFGVGTFTHWQDILANGWVSCLECSTAANVYWLSLAFLFATAPFVLRKPRATEAAEAR